MHNYIILPEYQHGVSSAPNVDVSRIITLHYLDIALVAVLEALSQKMSPGTTAVIRDVKSARSPQI